MKLVIPNNIYSTLIILSLDSESRSDIEVKEASLIANEIKSDDSVIGVIPSFDLINNKDFFVSKKVGVSFESLLSNSYIYFNSDNKDINSLLLRGDISTNEVILSKIVFQERYNISPEISLDSSISVSESKNYIITGGENWLDTNFKRGTSFSEQISDLIEMPYVNFIFASNNSSNLEKFNSQCDDINKKILSNIDQLLDNIGMDGEVNSFIKKNIDLVRFNFSEYENSALTELLQLAYYHQIFNDLFDVKFV